MRFAITLAVGIALLCAVASVPEENFVEDYHPTMLFQGVAEDSSDHELSLIEESAQDEKFSDLTAFNFKKQQTDEEIKARAEYKKLQKQKSKQKAKKRAARKKMRTGRRALRKNFRSCKKTITRKNPNMNSPKCKVFLGKELAEDELQLQTGDATGGRRRRRRRRTRRRRNKLSRKEKRAARRADRKNKRNARRNERKNKRNARKAARKNKRNARRNARKKARSLRRGLRKIKRKRKRELRKEWKKAKAAYKTYKKQLRGARFKVKLMPKIFKVIAPKLQKQLSTVNISDNANAEDAGVGVVSKTPNVTSANRKPDNVKTFNKIMKKFLQLAVESKVFPVVKTNFEKIQKKLWQVLDKIIMAIKQSIVGSVGSIPFVGGILAVVAGGVIDLVWGIVKMVVNRSLERIWKKIAKVISKFIVKACLTVGGAFKRNVAGAKKGASKANKQVTSAATEQYKKDAAASAKEAEGVEKSILNDGKDAEASLAKTSAKDANVDKEENAADDKAEEEDLDEEEADQDLPDHDEL